MIDDRITVVITSSPSRRHQGNGHSATNMIRYTIKLVRRQLPNSKILILLDGVCPEQEYLRSDYERYKRNLIAWSELQNDIECIEFPKFQHQTGMIRQGIRKVDTEQLLFIEHDFPVVGDIPWQDISDLIFYNQVDLVRFYLEPKLEPAHQHLFYPGDPVLLGNKVPVVRTGQWSQRPHLASTRFYKKIVNKHIPKSLHTYIEDAIHGFFGEPFDRDPVLAWEQNRMCIYHPLYRSISRCKHLDGRLGEEKYSLL